MSLDFHIDAWIGAADAADLSTMTMASLRIGTQVDGEAVVFTEVEDSIAQTVRAHIHVPAFDLAAWLVLHWWRLRWEARPRNPGYDWFVSHRMSGVGPDHAWPPIDMSSDGEFVQIAMSAERRADVAAIRYLSGGILEIPAIEFERAVDHFVEQVSARISARRPSERFLAELVEELRLERGSSGDARLARLQARAGFNPGEAPERWLEQAAELAVEVGDLPGEEIMAAIPNLSRGLEGAKQAVRAMRQSDVRVDLGQVERMEEPIRRSELPWERGARLARRARARLGLADHERVENVRLEQLVGVRLPMPSAGVMDRALAGGYRKSGHEVAVLVPTKRIVNQRFYLGKLLGCAAQASPDDRVLPVSSAPTAMQKAARSFAVELLAPWAALDAFTDEHGTDEEGIEAAADHFMISEMAVVSSLVNHHKVPRVRLVADQG